MSDMSDYSWNLAHVMLITAFREKLDVVARALGARNQFDRFSERAELKDNHGMLALVSIQGKAGVPETARVVSRHELNLVSKALFQNALSPCGVTFEVAT